ncbi:hypothetical protein [Amycolatopsis sp. CA-128772]|uniref:hypothetical protein n=1 Tax=Amycolatopsis sp. CA-128772 TaxID=2073159 RepID=UPI0011AFE9FF|nr:hypothetical protein [Amycolatopsis sp. CA-128772]
MRIRVTSPRQTLIRQKGKRKPIVHRKPVLATVRQLYGTAFRCGKPDCGKPLYKMNDETGETLLNSRVSHICAEARAVLAGIPT